MDDSQKKTDKMVDPVPATPAKDQAEPQKEIGGRKGPEPTRYGDWEKNGIISDF